MKRRKMMNLLLTAVLTLSVTACGGASQPGGNTSQAADVSQESGDSTAAESNTPSALTEAADPFGRYAETLEVHFVRATDDTIETNVLANLPGETLEDNFWLDTYEEELGIKIVYDWIVKGDDEFNQKMNVSMASEELPDVMCVTATQMMQLVDAGLVQDMGAVYEQYAADFTKEVMYQEGDTPFLTGQKEGMQYGLPVTGGSVDSVDLMWIRTDWLEKLNLEVPQTMDEVFHMADQFVNADFDGNGKKDTVGMGIAGTSILGGGFGGLRGFFNAYGAYPGIWTDKDGSLVYGAIQPECKTALAALHDMEICDFVLERQRLDGGIGMSWHRDGSAHELNGTAGAFLILPLAEAFLRTGERRYVVAAVRAYSFYYREFHNRGFGTGGALDTVCIDKESVIPLLKGGLLMYKATGFDRYLDMAQEAAWYLSSWQWHQSIAYPSDSALGQIGYDTFGGTAVSTSHHHMDPFALCYVPDLLALSEVTGNPQWKERSLAIWRNGVQGISDGSLQLLKAGVRPAGSSDEGYMHTRWGGIKNKASAEGDEMPVSGWSDYYSVTQWLVAWPCAFRLEVLRRCENWNLLDGLIDPDMNGYAAEGSME